MTWPALDFEKQESKASVLHLVTVMCVGLFSPWLQQTEYISRID